MSAGWRSSWRRSASRRPRSCGLAAVWTRSSNDPTRRASGSSGSLDPLIRLRREVVQVAAVAMRWVSPSAFGPADDPPSRARGLRLGTRPPGVGWSAGASPLADPPVQCGGKARLGDQGTPTPVRHRVPDFRLGRDGGVHSATSGGGPHDAHCVPARPSAFWRRHDAADPARGTRVRSAPSIEADRRRQALGNGTSRVLLADPTRASARMTRRAPAGTSSAGSSSTPAMPAWSRHEAHRHRSRHRRAGRAGAAPGGGRGSSTRRGGRTRPSSAVAIADDSRRRGPRTG